ncbi:uncharacterized protein LY79DRAFT_620613 [Colletotrichum navitas]|uniref:Uncharacterized protein n=1 Tax=Colletotrichum navitas TaxID=681940 RepID=A0AAD8UXM4_9PEZI|nr:uncharacterized protein LY79DRAFT_620613 [Colletotrichum navitas]KAK1561470.1 hypothetical protein LY79DRAFT_620613 [Colletotrichum navitas]
MKAFTVLLNLALACSAAAAAVPSELSGLEERSCGKAGAPCVYGDDCCVFCGLDRKCTDTISTCVDKGLFPVSGASSCCSRAVDKNGNCT